MSEPAPPHAQSPELHGHRRMLSDLPVQTIGMTTLPSENPTWRGWVLGFFCVAAICLVIPYFDFVLRGTMFSNSMFPASSVFILFALCVGVTALLSAYRTALGLTSQDLVLVFGMTMVVNAIPGCGFWVFWVTQTTGGYFFKSPENNYDKLVLPHIPESWAPHDNETIRPIEWFYTGLPPGKEIPWGAWVGPYIIWCLALLMIFGMIFALCGLLRRQWSDHEQLTFPLAQLPQDMVSGLYGGPTAPFLKDRLALWGIGLTFLFHSWNNFGDYFSQVPRIPQGADLHQYLLEPPLNALLPVWAKIYPSVIGLTYLLSLEISFSLWFYFLALKAIAFSSTQSGLLPMGKYWSGPFVDQGTGALIGMAVGALYMARYELGGSFLEAIGKRAQRQETSDPSPRLLWTMLVACFAGSVAWMMWMGVEPVYALSMLLFLLLVMVGMTRLSCEGGLFFMQMTVFPLNFVNLFGTPVNMGATQYVRLAIWDRVMVADWYRVLFMPNVMNGLHLASRTSLRRRPLMAAMACAVVVALVVSFFSMLTTAYKAPGGATQMAWYFKDHPISEYKSMAATTSQIASYETKLAKAEAEQREVPYSDLPDAARRDWWRVFWIGLGMGFMFLSLMLRRFFFWFPHPIGYVMWMGPYPDLCLWFSFFIGWAIKLTLLKFGGSRMYMRTKRFFIGIVIGEACAIVVWKLVALFANNINGINILPG
ncbi:MAG: hypothetical protein KIS92_01435 [Planctomycetota bacterium]|nr:hypothetical protein [Planctomycetota bacterium]